MLKIVNVFKSNVYKNDTRFQDEESKKVYYSGVFWTDGMHVVKNGMFTRVNKVGDEIVILGVDEDKLTPEDHLAITAFFSAANPGNAGFLFVDPGQKKEIMDANLAVITNSVGWWILIK